MTGGQDDCEFMTPEHEQTNISCLNLYRTSCQSLSSRFFSLQYMVYVTALLFRLGRCDYGKVLSHSGPSVSCLSWSLQVLRFSQQNC